MSDKTPEDIEKAAREAVAHFERWPEGPASEDARAWSMAHTARALADSHARLLAELEDMAQRWEASDENHEAVIDGMQRRLDARPLGMTTGDRGRW